MYVYLLWTNTNQNLYEINFTQDGVVKVQFLKEQIELFPFQNVGDQRREEDIARENLQTGGVGQNVGTPIRECETSVIFYSGNIFSMFIESAVLSVIIDTLIMSM